MSTWKYYMWSSPLLKWTYAIKKISRILLTNPVFFAQICFKMLLSPQNPCNLDSFLYNISENCKDNSVFRRILSQNSGLLHKYILKCHNGHQNLCFEMYEKHVYFFIAQVHFKRGLLHVYPPPPSSKALYFWFEIPHGFPV